MTAKERDWMNDGEEEPFTPFTPAIGATAIHVLFRAYVEAGFNEDQALRLVMASLSKHAG